VEALATAVGQSSTRQRILAALAVFAEKGDRAATTREIAARAGVAELTLFRHFSSKQGLFDVLLERAQPARALEGLVMRPGIGRPWRS
jgi:AcrR family transcriptional regulator